MTGLLFYLPSAREEHEIVTRCIRLLTQKIAIGLVGEGQKQQNVLDIQPRSVYIFVRKLLILHLECSL